MTKQFKADDKILKQAWQSVNPSQSEFIQKNTLEEWIAIVFKKTEKDNINDYSSLIDNYAEKVLNISSQKQINIQFKYEQAVQLINWSINSEQKLEEQQNQQNNDNEQNFVEDKISIEKDKHSEVQQYQQQFDQTNNINKQQKQQDGQIKYHNNKYLIEKWQENIKIIFNHYCKISYATGQDPTFEQIQHKITILNINKFMIFCRDFKIMKLNKGSQKITRNYLFENFKKNAQFYKQMSFDQFKNILNKIAIQVYQLQDQNQLSKLNSSIIKLFQYMQIHTNKIFQSKMKSLHIQYIYKAISEQQFPKIPHNNQFKLLSNNGKSSQQIQQELQQRKNNRSQRKKLLKQKSNNKSLNMKIPLHQINKKNVNSNPIKKKNLNPPLPPKRITVPNTAHQFKHQQVTGYANLYKIKMGNSTQGGVQSRARVRKLHLNSIVEQARLIVSEGQKHPSYTDSHQQDPKFYEQIKHPNTASDSNKLQNKPKNMSIHQSSSMKPLKLNNVNLNNFQQSQMNQLLNLDSDDQDEYLEQHLQRQSNQNRPIGERIAHRLQNLNRQ